MVKTQQQWTSLSDCMNMTRDDIRHFYNIHNGETCLLIGNGNSLNDLPLEFLGKYPSFGVNTIHRLDGFTPTYYAAGDWRVYAEFADAVDAKMPNTPKFLQTPTLDVWQGENVHRWKRRKGGFWSWPNGVKFPRFAPDYFGFGYKCITHITMQLAYFMGFETMLLVGADHYDIAVHYWGRDTSKEWPKKTGPDRWADGYKALREAFHPHAKIINISTHTELDEEYLPRGDWKDYA